MATWAPVVFWILLVPLLIIMLVVYLKSKQFYRLVYITSVFTYAMTIMYWIDAYKLGRNAIIGLLVASSLLMILVGWLMHKKSKPKRRKKSHNGILAIICLAVIAVIVGLSAMQIGWTVTATTVPSINLNQVVSVVEEGQPEYPLPPVPIYTVTVTNTFIPRQYELPAAQACLYNSEKKAGQWASTSWDTDSIRSDFGPSIDAIEVGRGSKSATLRIGGQPYYPERPVKAPTEARETPVYDKLLLFLSPQDRDEYVDCSALTQKDFERAIVIPIKR